MKRSRETGDSSSPVKKHKKSIAPQAAVVPLDRDFENSWAVDFFRQRKIIPEVRDQKERPSCGLHVVLEGKEMEEARHYALKGQSWRLKLDMRQWIMDFEVNIGGPLETFQQNILVRALRLAKDQGIPVEGSNDHLKITGYKYHKNMSFDEAAAILQEGRPIIGGFQYDRYFAHMKGKTIYSFNEEKFDSGGRKQPRHHVVLFVGYGVRDREPFLVFLNSWGRLFCQNGVGRIYFLEVRDFFSITR